MEDRSESGQWLMSASAWYRDARDPADMARAAAEVAAAATALGCEALASEYRAVAALASERAAAVDHDRAMARDGAYAPDRDGAEVAAIEYGRAAYAEDMHATAHMPSEDRAVALRFRRQNHIRDAAAKAANS